jgi:tripartite-type tricarboxylate transporter receptor subunit TctC
LAGEFDWTFGTPDQAAPQIRAGRIKPYAVTARTRMPLAPDVPTTDEAGLPGFYLSYWHGLWAPKGTPPDVIAKLNAAVRVSLADPTVQERFKKVGQEIWPIEYQTPDALAKKQKAELDKWMPVILESGIKAD